MDCIYIDPPYNTGARDWKYNNDYVDRSDRWRHSKWIAMMERRLTIAKRLLRPSGCLIVTIDDYEAATLALWIDQNLEGWSRTPVVIRYNRQGTPRSGLFRTHEYAYFVVKHDLQRNPKGAYVTTRNFRRNGTNSTRLVRPSMFFPILLDRATLEFKAVGVPLVDGSHPAKQTVVRQNEVEIWPIDDDGNERCWQWGSVAVQRRYSELEFRWKDDQVHGYFRTSNLPILDYETVWVDSIYDAASHGSALVQSAIGRSFPFPKSIYAVKSCIEKAVWNKPNALIVDFFAGSGTTLNAVNLINAVDGGRRRCILVTNNEVSGDEGDAMRGRALQPGDDEWEAQGICRSVTWPRSKFTIQGRRDDGTPLPGEYLTGRTRSIDKPRRFTQVGFVEPAQLDTVAKRKQVVALIDGLPQTAVTDGTDFVVSEDHAASVLFNPAAAEAWLEALEGQDHIASFFIVTPVKKLYDQIKAAVSDLLGPLQASEDDTRPMRDGFTANLAYFKLDFLDPERVSLKRAFREVLPLLWLKAGAVGPRPVLPPGEPEPALFEPEGCQFVVLLRESRLTRLLSAVQHRTAPLSHVFIVTDSDESFKRMAAEVRAAAGAHAAALQVLQLYRDYLANFLINRQQEAGDAPQGAAP